MNREERKQWYYEETHKIINGIIHKQCTKCKEWLPETDEYYYMRNKSKLELGLTSECKKCTTKMSMKYRKEHPDKKFINDKRYAETPAGRESKRKSFKKRYREGVIQVWIDNNKDKMQKYNQDRQHKNHKINKTEWENCKRYFDYKCAYCGLSLSEHYYTRKGVTKLGDFHKEHVDHEGSSDLSNCIPSCGSCNDQKWKFGIDEWYNENNPNFTEERYTKIFKWLTEDYKQYVEEYIPKRKYNKKVND